MSDSNVYDVYNDPYSRRITARKKRIEFNKLKNTKSFQLWKNRQIKVQDNKCAYCKVDLGKKYIVTHIDHVTPLYYDGKNNYNNFVLSCRRCNLRKWISNKYVIPKWIVDNDNRMRREQRLKNIRKKQYIQLRNARDESILNDILKYV